MGKLQGVIRKGRLSSANSQIVGLMVKNLGSESFLYRKGRLYASTAGNCSRASALFNLVPPSMKTMNGPASEFYFAIGNAYDDVLAKAFNKAGVLIRSEYNVPDIGINLGGRIDLLIDLDGEVTIIEAKSCGALPSRPKSEHAAQATIYSAICGFPAHLLYTSRNPADWKGNINAVSFQLDTSEERLRYHLTQAVLGHLYTKAKRVPPIPPEIFSIKDCGFCPFVRMCWDKTEEFPAPMIEEGRHEKALEAAAKRVDEILAKRDERRDAVLKELGRGKKSISP